MSARVGADQFGSSNGSVRGLEPVGPGRAPTGRALPLGCEDGATEGAVVAVSLAAGTAVSLAGTAETGVTTVGCT